MMELVGVFQRPGYTRTRSGGDDNALIIYLDHPVGAAHALKRGQVVSSSKEGRSELRPVA